jgi:5-methylthioribose kinase
MLTELKTNELVKISNSFMLHFKLLKIDIKEFEIANFELINNSFILYSSNPYILSNIYHNEIAKFNSFINKELNWNIKIKVTLSQ